MDTIRMKLLSAGANEATIAIAQEIHTAINTKIETFKGHSNREEMFESVVNGIVAELNLAITLFENKKRDGVITQNYDEEANKETLHNAFVRIQANYADSLKSNKGMHLIVMRHGFLGHGFFMQPEF